MPKQSEANSKKNNKEKQNKNKNKKNTNSKNKNKKIITKSNINREVASCMKGYKIQSDKNRGDYKYNTKEAYDNSFKDEKIYEFSKKVSDADKKKINYIIFNSGNSDGLFSAYVAWRFLHFDNKVGFLTFFEGKPWRESGYDPRLKYEQMQGKDVLIVDISYNKKTIDKIVESANSVTLIDDHPDTKISNTSNNFIQFIGEVHGACGYVWKFFYPKKEVPEFIQVIDAQDRKYSLSYIPFPQLMKSGVEFRFTRNKAPSFKKIKWD